MAFHISDWVALNLVVLNLNLNLSFLCVVLLFPDHMEYQPEKWKSENCFMAYHIFYPFALLFRAYLCCMNKICRYRRNKKNS